MGNLTHLVFLEYIQRRDNYRHLLFIPRDEVLKSHRQSLSASGTIDGLDIKTKMECFADVKLPVPRRHLTIRTPPKLRIDGGPRGFGVVVVLRFACGLEKIIRAFTLPPVKLGSSMLGGSDWSGSGHRGTRQ